MPMFSVGLVLAATLIAAGLPSPTERAVYTDKGAFRDKPVPHPLSWWTQDPLRLDADGDLSIGQKADDGHTISSADYTIKQTVKRLGTVAGHSILEIDTGFGQGAGGDLSWWKSLLVSAGSDSYVEIFRLQASGGMPAEGRRPAEIIGHGDDAILGTYDPDGGNGGGCWDGYWWFDREGAHEVNFAPLEEAIKEKIPKNSRNTLGCWALHLRQNYVESGVQSGDAACHACGWLGTVHAAFHIDHGVAIPVEIAFKPESNE